ncbi:unnamed protein product [Parnassius apollo]|uniref:(apollo) hypothetical protein n=1 Tax=Parnassius apollo TaxID=110799 RepID=A0A8S3X1F6_PARAO|nr:unnamed protein product [Parnassius apollo]
MAVQLIDARGKKRTLTSEYLLELIADGNESEIEGFEDEECHEEEGIEAVPDWVAGQSYSDDDISNSEQEEEITNIQDHMSRNDQLPDLSGNPPPSVRTQSEAAQRNRDPSRRSLRKSIPFDQKEHNFPPREQQTIRTPLEYFEDYFDDAFYEKASYCTNNYYLKQTGRVLHPNPVEMKFIGVHFIMGCITYPRLHMYWRQEMRLALVGDIIPRDRLKLLRTNFRVLEEDIAPVVANAWRLYKIHCQTAHVHRGQVFDLLQFKLQVADGTTNTPDRPRPEQDPVENMEGLEAQDPENVDPNIPAKRYRPANVPSETKRHDGYEHYPVFDEIENPRSCRMEGCTKRSKTNATCIFVLTEKATVSHPFIGNN